MIGILFLGVIGLLIWFAVGLTKAVARKIPSRGWRFAVAPVLFVVLLALPFADEIIGGFQLRALCETNAVLKVDAEKIRGKTVRVVIEPSNSNVEHTPIRIYYSHLSFRDAETNDEVASYSRYVAQGGWFIRTLAMTDDMTPLTIHPSSCSAALSQQAYGFKLIN